MKEVNDNYCQINIRLLRGGRRSFKNFGNLDLSG